MGGVVIVLLTFTTLSISTTFGGVRSTLALLSDSVGSTMVAVERTFIFDSGGEDFCRRTFVVGCCRSAGFSVGCDGFLLATVPPTPLSSNPSLLI